MAEQSGDKQHEPTERRRNKAREEGQVARSQDLASAVVLLASIILLTTIGRQIVKTLTDYARQTLGEEAWLEADFDRIIPHLFHATFLILVPVGIFMALLVVTAIAVNYMQVGWLFLPNKLTFDFQKINPIQGFTRMFSLQSFMRLVFGLIKIAICAAVAYFALKNELITILNLIENSESEIAVYTLNLLLSVSLKVAICLVILAILDYAYQKWKYEQDLRMTAQEMRDEIKEMMGDPQLVSKRRQIQREMAQNRMSQTVPQADVVVTNPTHLAVALKYDADTMAAPIVVAKGAGVIAKRIRQIALEHGVPILERKPLAQALFRYVEVNQQIPAEHFAAVAEILAYVYQLKARA
ncbi:MAG: flagellar biosynthesis protein FlhB [Planctomycetaceae bacterium]|jgi:flagellar biosynthetic protein FlhB|nr:flagellar biosynthesis protein FlhB [Planctomycetaceae bacterium]